MRVFGLTFILILLLMAFSGISCGNRAANVREETDKKSVQVKKQDGRWQFFLKGHPFQVKGGAGFTNLMELAAIGGNTIRTWDTTNLECVLNEAWGNKLMVLVGLEIPGSGFADSFYKDTSKVNLQERAIKQLVLKFRDHPALLGWCLGNELLFPYRPRFAPFYRAFNRLISIIHKEDGSHPVTTALSNYEKKEIINLKLKTSGIDFICINTYGQLKNLSSRLSEFEWFWDGPYLVGEWGVSGGWESEETAWATAIENTSTEKARQYSEMYHNFMPVNDKRFLGSLVFYWGAKQEFTHTWFSIFHESGTPTEVMEALYDCWNDTVTIHKAAQLRYMLVDKLGARDNLIFAPGSVHEAKVLLKENTPENTFKFYWEVLPDDWWGHFIKRSEKPAFPPGWPIDTGASFIRFNAPVREGPYRIFVTVFDNRGFCATANTPFYVVGP